MKTASPDRRPIPAVLAVMQHEDRFLLVRRANPPDAGYWGFPGGKMEPGETVTDAAVRELFEETAVVAEPVHPFTALDVFDRGEDGGLRRHFVLIAVLCRYRSGVPVAGDDALEARWFDLSSLASPDVQFSRNVAAVARLAADLDAGGVRSGL
ncbi:ADP-ribose pyrophosphatase (plasmid) [Sulfitobacter alexandrii]|uniref:ADP-ribose pyrophosphatase n=1 Tax=Sulfitobacter alexandrii TaxID=1917485 RepID=A0A1J0WP94_9RHOB|nr:NUDIX hydrolase [Sulfitobacter alexandrii]APE45974.1 ADP-ribose pyrophosphatase [Sulfitobacter alexandrii]